ncbi:MAG: hypothetical protein U5R49_00615 [Deltaproteobacteria bacterium]|nr:hypothetical protein [Deltaproteobacteria bacterium]
MFNLFPFPGNTPNGSFPAGATEILSMNALRVECVDYCLDSINPVTWILTADKIIKFQPEFLVLPWWVVFWFPQFLTIISVIKKRTLSEVVFICHNAIEHESSWWKIKATQYLLSRADRILTHSRQESDYLREILNAGPKIITAFHPSYAPLSWRVSRIG